LIITDFDAETKSIYFLFWSAFQALVLLLLHSQVCKVNLSTILVAK